MNNSTNTKLLNILTITLFDNETLLNDFQKKIKQFNESNYNFIIYLVINDYYNDIYHKYKKFEKTYSNVKVINNKTFGYSTGRNLVLNQINDNVDYVLFLDSDCIINSISEIDNLVISMNNKTKYVGYYGGYIMSQENLINNQMQNENDILIEEKNFNQYINTKFSLICYKFLKENTLKFDIVYDPFGKEDIDFCINVLNYTSVRKLKNDIHETSNTNTKSSIFSEKAKLQILKKNDNYFFAKHNKINIKVTDDGFINKRNFGYGNFLAKYENFNIEDEIYESSFVDYIDLVIKENPVLLEDKKKILFVSPCIYPAAGGGENMMLDYANFLNDNICISLCFRDTFKNAGFTNHKLIIMKNNYIIQTPYSMLNIYYILKKFNIDTIIHQGHMREEIVNLSNCLNLNLISFFSFWNGMFVIPPNNNIFNIDMVNKDFQQTNLILNNLNKINYVAASPFVNEIFNNIYSQDIPVIESTSIVDFDLIQANEGKCVTFFKFSSV